MMAGETTVTVIGNLVHDPELRFTNTGTAVSNFTVASTPRVYRDGSWSDGDTLFIRCNVWRQLAEHFASSLSKGDRVIVTGRLRQRSFKVNGERRTVVELDVDEVGVSLRYTPVKVTKADRSHGRDSEAALLAGEAQWGSNSEEPPF